jgi:hypothetical protein
MADCSKNNNYPLLSTGSLTRNIRFTTNRKVIEMILTSNNSVECTRNIDSNAFLGVKIVNNNLVYTDAILGLSTGITMDVSKNPLIRIEQGLGGVLNIIGVDDTETSFSVPQLNVRYDAATNTIRFQI